MVERNRDAPPLGSPTLLLVPSELELKRFLDLGGVPPGAALVESCGFGPVAAAARTSGLLERLHPSRVLLVGIAGAYDTDEHPVGEAFEFARVALEGVGVGAGAGLVAPPELGFPQWPGADSADGRGTRAIYDRLELSAGADANGLLLTTCAASADPEQTAQRRERFPDAVAEDMEGFAVAVSCALARVPLRVVRGVSNLVGERDPKHWRIPAALAAARLAAIDLLEPGAAWPVG